MTTPRTHAVPPLAALAAALGAAALLSACVVEAPARYVQAPPRPVPVYEQPAPVYQQPAPVYEQPAPVYEEPASDDEPDDASYDDPVVSVYVDPPIDQPEPIAVQWAPPPMLVEMPPPQPYPDAVWTGGYWSWEGRWVWWAGRWTPPPRPHYVWVQPYYEHRADVVVFVPGFWCAPERHFVPPPPGLHISLAVAGPGVRRGRPPMGPQGVFVPPPPGSRAGLIVPAPVGTPPAVVVSAPPVVNVGMRVRGNLDARGRDVANVMVEAPAGATANGQAFRNSVPARAHLAAELAPAGRPAAPRPVWQQAIPAFRPGRPSVPLPPGQWVRNERNDRFNWHNGGRPGTPQPGMQPIPAPQGQPQQPPRAGQGRAEFGPPPRQPAPVDAQPQTPGQQAQPAWQRGQQRDWQPGQQAQPAWQHGQQRDWQPGQPRPMPGQPPQGQVPGQPHPQWTPPPGQAAPANPQDPRRRGGDPQARPAAGQPGAQPAPQARGKDASEASAPDKNERRKPPREHPEDREKRNGERER